MHLKEKINNGLKDKKQETIGFELPHLFSLLPEVAFKGDKLGNNTSD